MIEFPLAQDHFEGGANLTSQQDKDLRDIINQLAFKNVHEGVVTPGRSDGPPGQQPQIEVKGALAYLTFTVDTDAAYRLYKIPNGFKSAPTAHVHWTKNQDTDQSTKEVRWRLTYNVFNGHSEDGADGGVVSVNLDDVYDDAGTTSRIVYCTEDVPLVGIVADYYLTMKIEAITPAGVALVEPGLVSLDLKYIIQAGTVVEED